MNPIRALLIALVALAVLPAAAGAVSHIQYPTGNDYIPSNLYFSTPSDPPKFNEQLGFIVDDTTQYTTQDDMSSPPNQPGSSNIAEPTACPGRFGHTFWSFFYAPSYGRLDVRTAGNFDSVIGVAAFKDLNHSLSFTSYGCSDSIPGFEEHFQRLVGPKSWFAIQVGGTGSPGVGTVQTKVVYLPPPRLDGDVVLTWDQDRRGAKVKTLVVSAQKGSRVSVSCTKHGCGKSQAFNVHKTKKYTLLKRRVLKAGSRLIIRVTRYGYVGKYFSYKVTKNGAGSKTIACTKPGSSKPRKKC
jgi:hypothetical protein